MMSPENFSTYLKFCALANAHSSLMLSNPLLQPRRPAAAQHKIGMAIHAGIGKRAIAYHQQRQIRSMPAAEMTQHLCAEWPDVPNPPG